MTRRKNQIYSDLGNKIYNYRMALTLKKKSREHFLSDRIESGIISSKELSIETLTNIEQGYTLPNLITLVTLSAALEVDTLKFIEEIISTLPPRKNL